MFTFWGRRGALSRFIYEFGHVALADPRVAPTISVSRQNESFDEFLDFGSALFPIDTFASSTGAVSQLWRIPRLRQQLRERIRRDRLELVVELMPHVWSPLVMTLLRQEGVRYGTVIHDAVAHPGDRTSWAKGILDRTMLSADVVFTLSHSVARRLAETGKVPNERLRILFHPDLHYGQAAECSAPEPGRPLRLLFLGRIMPYKGLPLFLDSVDILAERGIRVEVGVFGEGALGTSGDRLRRMGAEVVNRWLSETEIAEVLPRYHAMMLSYVQASQSGVAAAAFGAGLPVVATPVGGLVEQVEDGLSGVLAERCDASAVADAVERLLELGVYSAMRQMISRGKEARSMSRFVGEIVAQGVEICS